MSAYERQLARVRAYNKTPRGRQVKRAARLRQLERERAAKQEIRVNTGSLCEAIAHWRI